jgi:mono/diheme cytochrome c family protein
MKLAALLAASFAFASVPVLVFAAEQSAQENYKKHCVDCHGANGKAQTRLGKKSGAKDLTDKNGIGKLSDEDVFKTIKFGRKNKQGEEKMEPFGDDMSDKEINELVAYVRTFAK